MSSIPYNYGSYIDAKVAMTDTGHVSAGKQIQSPASAGSRGLAKTTQFTNDKTQMQLGQEAIAESMVEIRSILNRIDGVNAPVQEDIGDKGRIALEKAGFDPMKVKEYMAVFNDHGDTSDIDQMNMDKVGLADAMAMVLASHDVENESTTEDSGELSRLKELSGIEEDAGLTDQQKKGLEAIAKKYKGREGYNGDFLPIGYIKAIMSTGVGTDGMDGDEVEAFAKKLGKRVSEIEDEWEDFETLDNITNAMKGDINDVLGNGWDVNQALASAAQDYLYDLTESYEPFPEGDEFDIEEDEDFEEVLGPLGFPEDETELFDAEYQGRKVPLNKPMRGDVKKFKVYVKDPKTGNVKKVNFGHGGTSAKRPTMRIRKSNPKARKSFRARHNCANPGPKTKARYWSCRKW